MRFASSCFVLLGLATVFAATAAGQSVVLDGYCPVLASDGKLVLGKEDFSLTFDRRVYRFSSQEAKNRFQSNPFRYVPALQGDCVVCWSLNSRRIPGNTATMVIHKSRWLPFSRVFLFPNMDDAYQRFLANPELYEAADVLNNGNCPITGKSGTTEHFVVNDGFWMFFSSAEAKAEYLKRQSIRRR